MIEVPDNDIEYYERKVVRLEQDIIILQDELNRQRTRLRTAEDYEIKFRILTKNIQVDLQRARLEVVKEEEAKNKQRIADALKQNDEHWAKAREEAEAELRKEAAERLEKVEGELEVANRKLKEVSQKKEEMELFSFKLRKLEKDNAALEQQLVDIKRACERQKNDELTALRNQLNTAFRERLAAERQAHQARVDALNKKLIDDQTSDTLHLTLPELSNAELVVLKDLYAATKASHEKEIDQSQELILRKNAEIKSLLREQAEREATLQAILAAKNKEVGDLQEEVTRLRKDHQEELLELGRRLTAVKESEGEILKEQITSLTQQCTHKDAEMASQAEAHTAELQAYALRMTQEQLRVRQEHANCEAAIAQLTHQLREKEDRLAELAAHHSEKSRQRQEAEDEGEYENGILFLERQLRRAEHKNQENNHLFAKLESDFETYRKEAEDEIQRLHEQLRTERREASERLKAGEAQAAELVDQLAARNREAAHDKKQFLSEKLSLQVQIRTVTAELEELENDYSRLQEIRKQLEATVKAERNRAAAPRDQQPHSALEVELQGLHREKEEAMARKYEDLRRKAADETKQLQERLKQLELENISLKKAQQRLLGELGSNKENARADQEKKIATVSLELARLNNIYQVFLTAHSPTEPQGLGLSRRHEFVTPRVAK